MLLSLNNDVLNVRGN